MATPIAPPHDLISAEQAGTLPGLFFERCRRSAAGEAYREFDPGGRQWRSFTLGRHARAHRPLAGAIRERDRCAVRGARDPRVNAGCRVPS